MKKVFVILCIVVVGLLGLNMLPERAATADSEFVIGDLSKLTELLNVEPEADGRYSLVSVLEGLYSKIEDVDKRVSVLGLTISDLQTKLSYLGSGTTADSRVDSLTDWTEHELNKLWNELNELARWAENRLRAIEYGSGSILDSRLQWLENRVERIGDEINRLWSRVGY